MSFPRYGLYKDSGVRWLGSIPAHWQVTLIRYVACVVNGYPFDSKLFDPHVGHPLVRIRDLNSTTTEIRYAGDFIESAAVTSDDVLIGMDGDFNVGRWHGTGRALLNQRMCCIRGTTNAVTRLLEYALPIPLAMINAVTYATTVKHLSSAGVERTQFAFPPDTTEQLTLIRFLDSETVRIDALIAEQRRLIELLNEKRQAVISHAVTNGLNPDAPMKCSGVEWLGDMPSHWACAELKRIADVRTGVAKGKDLGNRKTVTVPYLRVANVQDGYLDLDEVATIEIGENELSRYALRDGDVLMNEGGDYDKLGRGCIWKGQIVPCITQNHVFAVRPRDVSSEWLNAVIGSRYAQFYFMTRSKQSTNLASISSTNLMKLPVLLPPTDEQRSILKFIEHQINQFDELVLDSQRAIALLHERRTALISAAVTGRIDVRSLAVAGVA